MKQINITPTPNQELSVSIDNSFFTIRLSSRSASTFIDILRGEEEISLGQRLVAGAAVVQAMYLLPEGNFVLTTLDGDVTDWKKFGSTQFLYYFSKEEVSGA